MDRLFSPDGEQALVAAVRNRPLLAFDFDGTLAPIVARPDDARVPAPVARRLQRLAACLPLAVITGRAVDDARRRLPFEPWRVVGNHGAEIEGAARAAWVHAAIEPARQCLQASAGRLHDSGVWVEDKGASIALHYRLAPDREAALAAITLAVAGLPRHLEVFGGKMVTNIVAAGAPDKGQALAALVAECGASTAVFFGDDVNDEPVFDSALPHWLTVRVGLDDPGTRARYVLDSLADLPRALDLMLHAIQATP